MIAPAVIYFFVFSYLPMAGIIIAFKNYSYVKGIFGSAWSGLQNFRYLFFTGDIYYVTKNTLFYNSVFLSVNTVLQVLVGIILAELASKSFKKVAQSMIFLPYFISWVVVGAFVYNIFNYEFGSLNTFLASIGQKPLDVYGNKEVWKYIITMFKSWKDIGYGSVLYLAAISSIDQEMYESAHMDGANIFQRIRFITLPALKPTMIILVLLGISNIFRGDFQMFYNIVGSNSLLYKSTDVIDTYVFRSLMKLHDFGMAGAAGLYQSALCFLIIVSVNYIVKKSNPDYALF